MADDPPLSEIEREIIDVLLEHGRLSTDGIADGVSDRSHIEILTGIRRLEQKGYVVAHDDETVSVDPRREE